MNKKYLIGIAGIYILVMYALIKLKQDVAANDFNWSRENVFVYVLILIGSVLFAILVDRRKSN